MKVRAATRADVPGILEIYNEAVINTTATYDYEPNTIEERLAWFEEHVRDDYPIFIAEDEPGRIAGWSSLSQFRARIGYRYSTENSVYVAPQHRGKGVGTLLMPPLIEGARSRGLHVIIAGIDAANPASIRLHQKFGFEEVARLKEVGCKFDRWLDVVYMQLIVPSAPGSKPPARMGP